MLVGDISDQQLIKRIMLQRVLEARENRAQQRKKWLNEQRLTLSLSFNIPGYPKSDNTISKAFILVKDDLLRYITSCRLSFNIDEAETTCDHAGDFFILPLFIKASHAQKVKKLFEYFEVNHKLSRLIDVDLFNPEGLPVSSGKVKKCLICPKPAIVCMREQNHSLKEIREIINIWLNDFLKERKKEKIKQKITQFATKALLYEVSVTPKPGLVDRFSQGSHSDMDFFTFISSSSALAFFWKDIVDLACIWNGIERENTLKYLRSIGIRMEEAMLSSTKGINTQKGAIYLMGFTTFAYAYCLYHEKVPTDKQISSLIAYLNTNIVNEELNNANANNSHGEKVFKLYGKELAGGIRKEVEEGLPTVFKISLPILRELGEKEEDSESWWNTALQKVLVHLIANNNDTNILFRSNANILAQTKQLAHICIEKNDLKKVEYYKKLSDFCKEYNISPGGSADLLAVTCFIYWLQKDFKEQ